MKQLTPEQFDRMILREVEKKDPYSAQREQAEEQKFAKIKKLQELGEKIHGQINNSFEHLNAFMSLGTKTRDTFEYKRAVAEIQRIQKLTANMATLITKAHETAEAEPEIQESPYDSQQMAAMANYQPKPSPQSMGVQESIYGVIMESYGSFKNVDVRAKSAQEALLKARRAYPAWEVKKVIILKEGLSVPEKHQLKIAYDTLKMPDAMVGVMGGPNKEEAKAIIKKLTGKDVKDSDIWNWKTVKESDKPPLFPDDDKKPLKAPKKPVKGSQEKPFPEPPSGSEVPPGMKDVYETDTPDEIPDEEWFQAYRGRKPEEENKRKRK